MHQRHILLRHASAATSSFLLHITIATSILLSRIHPHLSASHSHSRELHRLQPQIRTLYASSKFSLRSLTSIPFRCVFTRRRSFEDPDRTPAASVGPNSSGSSIIWHQEPGRPRLASRDKPLFFSFSSLPYVRSGCSGMVSVE
ncbi:hypothetical protein LR48_Vigan07g169000 [Vigna angularis]|uniref:Uncharacterized protein n=1 Tax=Phaseolus angularis TaxID=3914 RepID=A0A0L9UZ78_PHAAN|nr:hypothetical protein LR48_Vigan07g169000 [Vigna angularis]